MINDILNKLNIAELNEMQLAASESVLQSDDDLIVLSPTGTGKTLAYLLPLIQVINKNEDEVQAIVIVPGRELALQSSDVLKSTGCGISSFACYGGRPTMDEHRIIRELKPQIIFATPGRLNDHIDKNNFNVEHVEYLIIDEFDKCLEMGFQDEMRAVLSKLPSVKRRFLLSATETERIPQFVNVGKCRKLDFLSGGNITLERISTYKVLSRTKDKLDTLALLLRALGEKSCIVFLNYRESVERTASFLIEKKFMVSSFHGGLDQKEREIALYRFANGSANILVCTDLGSRGLDIAGVENIIHYHLPENEDSYIHRIGRTARWDAEGNNYFLLGPEEHLPEYIKDDIDEFVIPSEDLPEPSLPVMATLYIGKGKKDKVSKGDIVGFLCKKGNIKVSDIGKIDVKDRYAYVAVKRTKIKTVLKQICNEKIKGIKTIIEEAF